MERREIQKATRTLMKLRLEKLVMAGDLVGQLEIFFLCWENYWTFIRMIQWIR